MKKKKNLFGGAGMMHGIGIRHGKAGIVFFFLLACAAFALWAPNAGAQSNYYVDKGCSGCHGATPTTCNGCHHHGPSGDAAATNKTSYAPGETVTVTFTGGRSSGATVGGGWIRAILYLNNVEIARSTGTGSPPRGGSGFPINFTTTAPASGTNLSYQVAWFGNLYDSGNPTNANHGEQRVSTNLFSITATAALTISTASPLTAGTVGTAYTPLTFASTGGTGTKTWAVSAGTLPAGLALSTAGVLSGTPTAATAVPTPTFTVQVTDGASATATKVFSLTINPATAALTISTASPLTAGTVGTAYTPLTFASTGGTGTKTWAVSAGTLPAGLALSTAGVLSGTPTAATVVPTPTFTVRVTDGASATATKVFSLTINPATAALTISTASLPAGTVGTAYTAPTFASTGGTGTKTWAVSAGTLPAGLALSAAGVLSGTPTAATAVPTPTFTVQVTDGASATATKVFSITINPAASTGEVTVMPADGAVDVPVNSVVTATETGTGDIVSIFNAQTFSLKLKGPATAATSLAAPADKCVEDGVVKGAISYSASNTAGTFTPACPLSNATIYEATITPSSAGLSATKVVDFTTIAASPDTDGDGVPDSEDDHPGDKGKGSPPSSRGKGKFLVDATGTAGASLAFTEGIAETSASLNQAGKPSGYDFPDGLVSYQVIDVAPGSTVTVKVTFPSGIPAGSKVYKVGPAGFKEVVNPAIQGHTVTLTLTDGGQGDSDGLANGVIVDPVGVAVPATSGTGSVDLSSASGGGGCSVAVRTGSGGSAIDGTLILAGLGLTVWGIRIRRRRG